MYAQTEQSNISTGPCFKILPTIFAIHERVLHTHRAENRKNEHGEENGKTTKLWGD